MTWHRPNSSAGRITSPFGQRTPPYPGASAYHLGVDLRAGVYGVDGSIYAAQDGIVSSRYVTPMGANVVVLDHGGGIKTYYVHMPDDGINVRKGDRVTGGQRIAVAGMTGAATVHLHFETRVNGTAVDPVPFMRLRGIDLTVTTVSNTIPGGGPVVVPTLPGAPAPITPIQEGDMKILATNGTSPDVWIGDGVTRRRIATQDTLNTVKYLIEHGLITAKSSTVETIADLWALGHPVDVAEDQTVAAVQAAADRAVAETSAAYHQLAALIASDDQTIDVDALAAALVERLPKSDAAGLLDALAARLES